MSTKKDYHFPIGTYASCLGSIIWWVCFRNLSDLLIPFGYLAIVAKVQFVHIIPSESFSVFLSLSQSFSVFLIRSQSFSVFLSISQ